MAARRYDTGTVRLYRRFNRLYFGGRLPEPESWQIQRGLPHDAGADLNGWCVTRIYSAPDVPIPHEWDAIYLDEWLW